MGLLGLVVSVDPWGWRSYETWVHGDSFTLQKKGSCLGELRLCLAGLVWLVGLVGSVELFGLVWWVGLVGLLGLPVSGGWVGWVELVGLVGLVGWLGLAGCLG